MHRNGSGSAISRHQILAEMLKNKVSMTWLFYFFAEALHKIVLTNLNEYYSYSSLQGTFTCIPNKIIITLSSQIHKLYKLEEPVMIESFFCVSVSCGVLPGNIEEKH